MTPKKKANELFTKMYHNQGYDRMTEDDEAIRIRAKVCALIAVEEIISVVAEVDETSNSYQYWQEVKTILQSK